MENGFVVFISSNLVFDRSKPFNTIDNLTNSIEKLAKHKVMMENAVDKNKVAIIRMTQVISPQTPLIKTWKAILAEGRNIYAFA